MFMYVRKEGRYSRENGGLPKTPVIHDPSWTEVKTGRAWDMYGNEDRRRLDTHRSEREGHLWGGGGEGEAIKMSASSCLLSLNSHHVQASPLHLFIFFFVLVLDLILLG